MKISIIGTGSIGRRHLRNCLNLQNECGLKEIIGFDLNPDRREQAQNENPTAHIVDTLEKAIKGVDAIFICVPTSLHTTIIDEISKLGSFHLFIEKPLAEKLAGCENYVFSHERLGKIIHVGYMLQHHPVLLRAKELISSGKVGRPLSVRAEAGFFLPNWHPWEKYQDFYMSWKSGGGGALLDISHEINYLMWLFGDINEVKGFVDKVSDLEITSDDLALGLLSFKNNIYGQVQLDLLQFEESRYMKVIGTKGVLFADLVKNCIRYNVEKKDSWKEENFEVNFDNIYHTQLREFIKACRGQNGAIVSAREAMKTMEVIEAIRRSHSLCTSVRLPLYE